MLEIGVKKGACLHMLVMSELYVVNVESTV